MTDAVVPTADQLRKEIELIIKDADLSTLSSKRVREQVEKKLGCSLLARKKEFDNLVMSIIDEKQDDESESSSSSSSDDEEEEPPKKAAAAAAAAGKRRPQPTQHKAAAKKKRKSLNASDTGSESDAGSDSDYEVPKKAPAKTKKEGKGKTAAAGANGGTVRKSTGFTRAYNLSPDLAGLVGSESMARHEVVKKVWQIIKERNLYDPKNKQFTICDDELFKVMKVKRFRTFSMLKHLKPHFLD